MKHFLAVLLSTLMAGLLCQCGNQGNQNNGKEPTPDAQSDTETGLAQIIDLPPPRLSSEVSLEETLADRYSLRQYSKERLTIEEVSQLLWSAQGITHGENKRTAPSAGQTYPIEVYVATPDYFYHYLPQGHRAEVLSEENLVAPLGETGVSFVAEAPAIFIIAAVFARTEEKYKERAERYVKIEAGHVAQNILLQAVALRLGGCPVGAYDDEEVQRILNLPDDHEPLYLIPVGRPEEKVPHSMH